jgi:hypothetical protein
LHVLGAPPVVGRRRVGCGQRLLFTNASEVIAV